MKLIRGLHNLEPPASGCVATIGNFDGVHLGHRVILEQVKAEAARRNLPSVVMVFEPQPREYFQGEAAPARLMRFREKLVALREAGIDYVVCLQFNRRLRELTAEQFVRRVLVEGLHLRHLVVGDDFRFGCDRAGDFQLLQRQGQLLQSQGQALQAEPGQQGFSVEHTRTVEIDGDRVSSTRIRQVLAAGKLTEAERLLGHPYSMSGRVIHGEQLGRKLGVPTANLTLGRRRSPLAGVFAVEVEIGDQPARPGVANLGTRPTVNGVRSLLEVHLLDFNELIYGRHLRVMFRARLRDEKRFESLDALKAQLANDIAAARAFFSEGQD